MQQALLILAHGSRDAGARAEYARLGGLLAARLPNLPVEFVVLEFPGDGLASIEEGVRACVQRGAERIVALPFFLFAAGHVRDDLPGELRSAARAAGDVQIAYQPPLGVDRLLLEVLELRATEAEARLGVERPGPTALLLVGAGTSDCDANADLYRASRLLWERGRFDLVEVAFVSLTRPSLAEGLERCQLLGARRIVVAPYFLNTGILSRRIASRLEATRTTAPGLEVTLAGEVGLHVRLIDLLVERARAGLERDQADGLGLPPCATSDSAWACWTGRTAAQRSR
jgi:sirohydrochlorin cobaltochelatase